MRKVIEESLGIDRHIYNVLFLLQRSEGGVDQNLLIWQKERSRRVKLNFSFVLFRDFPFRLNRYSRVILNMDLLFA